MKTELLKRVHFNCAAASELLSQESREFSFLVSSALLYTPLFIVCCLASR